jgi:hypothetical protein
MFELCSDKARKINPLIPVFLYGSTYVRRLPVTSAQSEYIWEKSMSKLEMIQALQQISVSLSSRVSNMASKGMPEIQKLANYSSAHNIHIT